MHRTVDTSQRQLPRGYGRECPIWLFFSMHEKNLGIDAETLKRQFFEFVCVRRPKYSIGGIAVVWDAGNLD